jgi:putative membrane protein
MVIRENPRFFSLFCAVRYSIIPKITSSVLIVIFFTLFIIWFDQKVHSIVHISLSSMGIFGVALSLFLGFRNNAAYDRWWEARKLWGQITTDMRTLSRDLVLYLSNDAAKREILCLGIAFIYFHQENLRKTQNQISNLSRWIDEETLEEFKKSSSPCCEILNKIAKKLRSCYEKGDIDGFGMRQLSERLWSISEAQVGCERIAQTPLPFVYSLLVLRTTFFYCLLVPFALIDSAGWLAPVFSGVTAYVFFGLAEVTNELEQPFNPRNNGLPLNAIVRNIEIALMIGLGEEPPKRLLPVARCCG